VVQNDADVRVPYQLKVGTDDDDVCKALSTWDAGTDEDKRSKLHLIVVSRRCRTNIKISYRSEFAGNFFNVNQLLQSLTNI